MHIVHDYVVLLKTSDIGMGEGMQLSLGLDGVSIINMILSILDYVVRSYNVNSSIFSLE